MSTFWDYEKKATDNHAEPESEAAHWLRMLEERAGEHLAALLFAARKSSDPAVIQAVVQYDEARDRNQQVRVAAYDRFEATPWRRAP